jgi:hypothetical protein
MFVSQRQSLVRNYSCGCFVVLWTPRYILWDCGQFIVYYLFLLAKPVALQYSTYPSFKALGQMSFTWMFFSIYSQTQSLKWLYCTCVLTVGPCYVWYSLDSSRSAAVALIALNSCLQQQLFQNALPIGIYVFYNTYRCYCSGGTACLFMGTMGYEYLQFCFRCWCWFSALPTFGHSFVYINIAPSKGRSSIQAIP